VISDNGKTKELLVPQQTSETSSVMGYPYGTLLAYAIYYFETGPIANI
jgi:hypothetical protein